MGKGKGDKLYISQKEWSRDFKGYRVSGGSDGQQSRVGKPGSQQSRRIVHNALAQRVLKDMEKSTDSVSLPLSTSDASKQNQQSALVLPKPAVGDVIGAQSSWVSKPSSGGVGKYLKLDSQNINQSKSKDITEKNNGTHVPRTAKVGQSHHPKVGTMKTSQKLSDFSSW
ncbi:hypothetical protein MIR68_004029 [Amoeboaphelidium protococcarum]|nr:hypothetical protein MIR68_004029 [Amoeboaphelidium protococcarum]